MDEATYGSGARIAKYELVKHIGSGGMGEVWLARDTFLDRSVAIKLLRLEKSTRPELRERMQREAQAGVRVDHPNVIKVIDGGLDGDIIYIVMEYLEGGRTLRDILGRAPRGLPLPQALGVAYQIVDAVIALHAVDILHRDLKPENIMVVERGRVKLIDFGLARIRTNIFRTTAQPKDGRPYGTLPYMAPEQLREQKVDAKCDIYPIGLVLWEMLTGRHPMQRSVDEYPDQHQIIYWQLNKTPPPLAQSIPGVPEDFSALVGRCCDKDPERRPTAWEVGQVLSGVIARLPERPRKVSTDEAVARDMARARIPRHGTIPLAAGYQAPSPHSPPPIDPAAMRVRVETAAGAAYTVTQQSSPESRDVTTSEPVLLPRAAVDSSEAPTPVIPAPRRAPIASSAGTKFVDVDPAPERNQRAPRPHDAKAAVSPSPGAAAALVRVKRRPVELALPRVHPKLVEPARAPTMARALAIGGSGIASGILLGSLVVIVWARVWMGPSPAGEAALATATSNASASPAAASSPSVTSPAAPEQSTAPVPAAPATASAVEPTPAPTASRPIAPASHPTTSGQPAARPLPLIIEPDPARSSGRIN